MYLILADFILILHVSFVAFVVFALLGIYIGYFRQWAWVRNPGFRVLHLISIGIVVAQSWFGMICPLTSWEMALREIGGGETYQGSFIQHWLHYILYYSAPDWVFILLYTSFGILVLASWFVVRPRRFGEISEE